MELYSVELGHLVRADVRALQGGAFWGVSINGVTAGEHATIDAASATASREIDAEMKLTIEMWERFKTAPPLARRFRRY